MAIVADHPTRLALISQWYDHDFPIIAEANDKLCHLLLRLRNREEWEKLNTQEQLAAIESVVALVTQMLGQVLIPF